MRFPCTLYGCRMCSSHAARDRNISSITQVLVVLRLHEVHEHTSGLGQAVPAHGSPMRVALDMAVAHIETFEASTTGL